MPPGFSVWRWGGAKAGLVVLLSAGAIVTSAFVVGASGATGAVLPPAPTGLPQTWIASLHLSGHVFHPGERITMTAHVNAATCFVNDPPCVSGANWEGIGGKIVSGCRPKVPHGTPTIHCTWIAEPTAGWMIAGANFSNPTGTSAVSEDFYIVVGKDTHVLDGHVSYRQTEHPVPGVHLSIKGVRRYAATTNGDGYYAQALPQGMYTVVPEGGTRNVFHPASRRVVVSGNHTADFALDENPLGVAYEMPARLVDANHDGLVDYNYDPGFVNPSSWTVDVRLTSRGGACDAKTTYTFRLDQQQTNATAGAKPCEFVIQVPKQGKYLLEVTGKSAVGEEVYGKKTIVVRDFLIGGLGDSVGSGEGNPDVPGTVGVATTSVIGTIGGVPIVVAYPTGGSGVRWEDARCDRSANSFEAVAARGIEDADSETSVTFLHLACSGAGIAVGEVAPYFGIAPNGAELPLVSQVSQLQSTVGSRKVDAIVISIGANDIGFGDIVKFCIEHTDCQNHAFNAVGQTLDTVTKAKLKTLPGLYDRLASRLQAAGVPAKRIYITQYFDPTRGSDGTFCDRIIGGSAGPFDVGFTADEAAWAYNAVVRPLNLAVATAATKHTWHLVGGEADGFRTHGYCASNSWIVSIGQTLAEQGNQYGAMHPNLAGHRFTGKLVKTALERDLYPGGKPRQP
jgi:hypothetical protein